jgi:hypothetical protein
MISLLNQGHILSTILTLPVAAQRQARDHRPIFRSRHDT